VKVIFYILPSRLSVTHLIGHDPLDKNHCLRIYEIIFKTRKLKLNDKNIRRITLQTHERSKFKKTRSRVRKCNCNHLNLFHFADVDCFYIKRFYSSFFELLTRRFEQDSEQNTQILNAHHTVCRLRNGSSKQSEFFS